MIFCRRCGRTLLRGLKNKRFDRQNGETILDEWVRCSNWVWYLPWTHDKNDQYLGEAYY